MVCGRQRPATHIQTSGEFFPPADLRLFGDKINPMVLFPVHGVNWDSEIDGLPLILRLNVGDLAAK
jgi:hypothetical protein